jgi:hypothetical protein
MIDGFELPLARRADEPPEYSAEDIVRARNGDSKFASLIYEIGMLLGKVLSSGDLTILYGLYDYLGLPIEVILLMSRQLLERDRSRKIGMRDIEKEGYRWAKSGVVNLDLADAYLAELSVRNSEYEAAKFALGVYGKLGKQQEAYLCKWLELGYCADSLEVAYDRTTTNIGEFSWAYADKIIHVWHAKGLFTPSEIELGDPPRSARKRVKSFKNQPHVQTPATPAEDEMRRIESLLSHQSKQIQLK